MSKMNSFNMKKSYETAETNRSGLFFINIHEKFVQYCTKQPKRTVPAYFS